MSAKGNRRNRSSEGSQYLSAWSAWEWNNEYSCEFRYRHRAQGDYEYEYGPCTEDSYDNATPRQASPATNDPSNSYTPYGGAYNVNGGLCPEPSCVETFATTTDRDRHFRTVHSNNGERPYKCLRVGCPANVTSWTNPEKLRTHNNAWHGPYPCSVTGCSRVDPHGFGSRRELDEHQRDEHSGASSAQEYFTTSYRAASAEPISEREPMYYSQANYTSGPPDRMQSIVSGVAQTSLSQTTGPINNPPNQYIHSRDRSISFEKFDPNYKVHPSSTFKWGLVFKVLWAEPKGSGSDLSGDQNQYLGREGIYGEGFQEKVRRFIVVGERQGHSICLPILTYGGQGTLKRGVHPDDHAVVYTDSERLSTVKGEKLTRKAICIVPSHRRHKLDSMSRLNYAKLYTVEHNVKIWPVGNVHPGFESQLVSDYNDVHPPMAPRGLSSAVSANGGVDTESSNDQPYSQSPPSGDMLSSNDFSDLSTSYCSPQSRTYVATS